ncbi:bifunctional riboflavin kinase/FAD synthetase [Chitinophagaceae bacterium MMS25-I14]
MAVYYNIEKIPAFRNAVLTIGTFDGVHQGHKAILKEVVHYARNEGGESVLVTFDPHPRKLLFPNESLMLITPLDEKLRLITEEGIDHIVVVPFTKAFSNMSAAEYIGQFLVKYFHPKHIIIGYDHHFGHDRTGDIALLRSYEQQYGYTVNEIPAQLIEAAAVSSTKIRKAVQEGDVVTAAHMLGREYTLAGKVVRGAQRGRTIGFPTANIRVNEPEQQLPAYGVYAVMVNCNGQSYKGMLNIGFNPTVTDQKITHIEVHIFDFSDDIYDQPIEVAFVARMREEKKFGSLDELKQALHHDQERALQLLAGR